MVWQTDLIQAIACFIADANTLFHFLTALEPTNNLGGLSHLLSRLIVAGDSKQGVWPILRITSRTVDDPTLKELVKCYSHIELAVACDFSWLHVAPSSTVHLSAFPAYLEPEASDAWYHKLTRWPVTHITWTRHYDEDLDAFLAALPRMRRLTSLTINHETSLAPLLEFISTSKLTEVHIMSQSPYTGDGGTCNNELTWLTKWLESQPVQAFSWFNWETLKCCSSATTQAFLDALAQSPALISVGLNWLSLADVRDHSFRLPPSLKSLTLDNVYVETHKDEVAMAKLMQKSNVQVLSIHGARFFEFFHAFLDGLPTSLVRLTLQQSRLTYVECHLLAQFIPTKTIVHLDLSENTAGNRGARALAKVLEASSIEELCLNQNNLTEAAVKVLIEVAHAKQPPISLSLIDNSIDDEEQDSLITLARQRGVALSL
ncbi:Aste57867_19229 [Aphanomyces stellatus]|uniref:Aste57867_15746 protein n=1 Tax=Aphanomyces stellatus TaxID=120398 RepID=A0A485L3S7_9STRA|nr:hypothetical protein As57867_019165 [Aphanomyces stellatus]KAF0693269.1 hypothetical protein As57867_015690 [Aphanomyces stellatus]VFT92535.1 Aste57867_15746 [Aphanomyces stellatus]VFT95950.1 Aste57867_19229 [Aphanomyces stellatus]